MTTPESKTTVIFNPQDHMALIQAGGDMLAEANALVVDSDVMYQEAGELCSQIKGSIKRIEDAKESLLKPVRQLDRAIRALFDPAIERRKAAETVLKSKQIAYFRKKEEEAEAARRAAEEAARKERERLEREAAAAKAKADAEAEAKRKAAEEAEAARKKAEEEGRAKDAAAAAAKAARLREEADQKEQGGERAAADLQERAQLVSTAPAEIPAAPKAAGTAIRRPWKARITDKEKLLLSIAKNPKAYMHLVDINEGALNKMASGQQKGLEAVLEGIEVYQDYTTSQRAA